MRTQMDCASFGAADPPPPAARARNMLGRPRLKPRPKGDRAMKLRLVLLAAAAALGGCQAKVQQSVENQFQQTEASIENTANTIENATEVSTRAAANEIDAQANLVENRADAVARAATGRPPANGSTSNSHK